LPECRTELTAPSCNIDADCKAGCKGQAQFEATCTEPKIVITGGASATLTTTLEANLPAIYEVLAQTKIVASAAVDVAGRAVNVGGEVAASAACVATYGASFATQLQASVAASASVNVSVSASANVRGSTG